MTFKVDERAQMEPSWVEVVWSTPATTSIWEQLQQRHLEAERLLLEKGMEPEAPEVVHLGPVLADATEQRIGAVTVRRVAGASEGTTILHWSLEVRPTPSGEIPERFKQVDALLGGRQGLVDLLSRTMGHSATPIAVYEVRLFLKEEQWECRLLPRRWSPEMDAPILDLADGASIERLGYRLKNGANGIEEISITYLHEQGAYMAVVRSRGILKLSYSGWLPFANDIQELVVGRLFARKEGES